MSDRLFTPRFLTMCAYSFTVFVSLFQLLPTAPYHVIDDLGGGTTAADHSAVVLPGPLTQAAHSFMPADFLAWFGEDG